MFPPRACSGKTQPLRRRFVFIAVIMIAQLKYNIVKSLSIDKHEIRYHHRAVGGTVGEPAGRAGLPLRPGLGWEIHKGPLDSCK